MHQPDYQGVGPSGRPIEESILKLHGELNMPKKIKALIAECAMVHKKRRGGGRGGVRRVYTTILMSSVQIIDMGKTFIEYPWSRLRV